MKEVESTNDPMPVVKYSPTDAAIAELKQQLEPMLADPKAAVATRQGYEQAKTALAITRGWRSKLEDARVKAKASALEYGRKVDSEAKAVLAKILAIETPIKTAKDEFDAAKEKAIQDEIDRKKREEEAALKAKQDAEEAERRRVHEAEQAALKAEREAIEAERRKMAEEKAAEDAKRKAESDRIAAEQKAEADRLAAEQKKIDDEKARLAKIEADRIAKEKAEQEAKDRAEFERKTREEAEAKAKAKAEADAKAAVEKAERDRIEKERLAAEQAENERIEKERIEAAKPDISKINRFGDLLEEWATENIPEMKQKAAKEFMATIRTRIDAIVADCQNRSSFKGQQ